MIEFRQTIFQLACFRSRQTDSIASLRRRRKKLLVIAILKRTVTFNMLTANEALPNGFNAKFSMHFPAEYTNHRFTIHFIFICFICRLKVGREEPAAFYLSHFFTTSVSPTSFGCQLKVRVFFIMPPGATRKRNAKNYFVLHKVLCRYIIFVAWVLNGRVAG